MQNVAIVYLVLIGLLIIYLNLMKIKYRNLGRTILHMALPWMKEKFFDDFFQDYYLANVALFRDYFSEYPTRSKLLQFLLFIVSTGFILLFILLGILLYNGLYMLSFITAAEIIIIYSTNILNFFATIPRNMQSSDYLSVDKSMEMLIKRTVINYKSFHNDNNFFSNEKIKEMSDEMLLRIINEQFIRGGCTITVHYFKNHYESND